MGGHRQGDVPPAHIVADLVLVQAAKNECGLEVVPVGAAAVPGGALVVEAVEGRGRGAVGFGRCRRGGGKAQADDQSGRDAYAARRPDWARQKAGCSKMSCTS